MNPVGFPISAPLEPVVSSQLAQALSRLAFLRFNFYAAAECFKPCIFAFQTLLLRGLVC